MSKRREPPECIFYVCCGSKCKKRGGKQLHKDFKTRVKAERLKQSVQVIKTGCTDRCKYGPVVAAMPQNEWHLEVTPENIDNLFIHYTSELKDL